MSLEAVVQRLEKPFKQSELLEAIVTVMGKTGEKSGSREAVAAMQKAEKPLRVLVVEDHRVNQELALGILGMAGHQTALAHNGREAVDLVGRETFDVVLMDVQMPELDGIQATAEIRRREEGTGKHVPIIAMTAHAMSGDREKCLEAGMDNYISKPIRAATLLKMLQTIVPGGGEGEGAGAGEAPGALPGEETEIFNREEARRQCLGNEALVERLVQSFLESLPRTREVLQMAVAQGDMSALAKGAHALKGAAGSIEARRCQNAALVVERAGKDGDGSRSKEALERLWIELDALEAVLRKMQDDRQPSGRTDGPPGSGKSLLRRDA